MAKTNKKEKLTDSQLLAIIEQEEKNSIGWLNSQLASQRATAMDYYMGEPFGNEVEGRSQVVSRDVMDTIEWIMPSIVKIFTAGDNIVRFEPQGPEDQAVAKQVTDGCNYVFQKQNDGFRILHNWFKDALLQKNGFVKVYWEEEDETNTEIYEGLTDDEVALLLQDKSIEPVEHTAYPDQNAAPALTSPPPSPQGGAQGAAAPTQQTPAVPPAPPMQTAMLHDIKVRRTEKSGRICVENVPPEEILIRKQTRAVNKEWCKFIAHRSLKTYSELREQGFDVDELNDGDDVDLNQETIARYKKEEDSSYVHSQELDESTRTIWVTEAYIQVDFDGDGIAELRQVIKAGNKVLSNDEVDQIPLITLTPILMPHKAIGLSVADLVSDLQFVKSTVLRQLLDNMYLQNNQRYMALDGMVNLQDLMISRPGGIVRVKTFDAVKPLASSPVPTGAYNLLEYIDSIRENRTGITRYNQGMDPNSLNKTAQGINQIMTASQQRIELIARVFAETGVKDLFWLILKLLQKHQVKPMMVRLNNQWTSMDPREWSTKFDVSVSVGLGTGSKDRTLQSIQGVMAMQGAALQAKLPIVEPMNIYNAAIEYCKAAELKGGDLYFTDPTQAPPQQPQPDPAVQKAQMDNETKMKIASEKNQLVQWKTLVQAEVKKQMSAMQQQHTTMQAGEDRQHEMAIHATDVVHDAHQAAMDREQDLKIQALAAAMQNMMPTGPQ